LYVAEKRSATSVEACMLLEALLNGSEGQGASRDVVEKILPAAGVDMKIFRADLGAHLDKIRRV